jgi:uncharacterized protein YcbX
MNNIIKVGVEKNIWRYPVKSMFGEEMNEVIPNYNCLPKDRAWILRDEEKGEIDYPEGTSIANFNQNEILTCIAKPKSDLTISSKFS